MSTYDELYEKALKLLSIRMHTVAELRNKLRIRGASPGTIEEVLAKLVDSGYLNDSDFAKVYLENLKRYKTYGYYGIKSLMLKRGIDGQIIDSSLSENLTVGEEILIAQKFMRKSKAKDREKTIQSMARKGFRREVIDFVSKT